MPTYNSTARWLLRKLTGANAVSDIDAGFDALAEDIDPKLTPVLLDNAANRPAATKSFLFTGLDTKQVFLSNGSEALEMARPSPRVTSWPPSGTNFDGRRATLATGDATAPVEWEFRYSASLNKWIAVGENKPLSYDSGTANGSVDGGTGIQSTLSGTTVQEVGVVAGAYEHWASASVIGITNTYGGSATSTLVYVGSVSATEQAAGDFATKAPRFYCHVETVDHAVGRASIIGPRRTSVVAGASSFRALFGSDRAGIRPSFENQRIYVRPVYLNP